MPYDKRSELPDPVKNILPKHAQEIHPAAFNNAWDKYQDPAKRAREDSREGVAPEAAWAAVKQGFYKNDVGNWVGC
ncbi:hypothetical protein VT06_11230 [Arsukibacterium sp. MJ3]|uniref:ChaB family protein n=1 Tax=Arsukibacterium sp. MJ3 TaxID=1632859 RepID=UPI0006271B65|nr:ChaB family protein [Arsukibacterium sp. MJ3]KKO48455.1 hypothetical protein VT06_11230 [Arsukibacterium sp. MJ3]